MANISRLLELSSGKAAGIDLSANTLLVSDLQINSINLRSTASGSSGSTGIGDNNSYSYFTPLTATIKGALSAIDTALGSISTTVTKTQVDNAVSNSGSNGVSIGPNTPSGAAVNSTLLGAYAGSALTTANSNTFIGYEAGKNTVLSQANTAVGHGALRTQNYSGGSYNGNNTAIGTSALYTLNSTNGSNGSGNSAVGLSAGYSATTATNNSFFGINSGYRETSGNNNTFLGAYSGQYYTSGSYNTALGWGVGPTSSSTISGTVAIGADSSGNPAVATTSNDFVLGTANHNVKIPGTLVLTTAVPISSGGTGQASASTALAALAGAVYDQIITIVASGGSPPGTVNGPVSPGTALTLPASGSYLGRELQIYLNGQLLIYDHANNYDWTDSGASPYTAVKFNDTLAVGDTIRLLKLRNS